jgi:hypothetical protein
MNKKDITGAIKDHLEAIIVGQGISFPNVDDENKAPYVEIIFGTANRPANRIKGGPPTRETGIFTVNVHIDLSAYGGEDTANDAADAIAEGFVAAVQIPFVGGIVTILEPPDIRAGVPTQVDWYVPVVVSYSAKPI